MFSLLICFRPRLQYNEGEGKRQSLFFGVESTVSKRHLFSSNIWQTTSRIYFVKNKAIDHPQQKVEVVVVVRGESNLVGLLTACCLKREL